MWKLLTAFLLTVNIAYGSVVLESVSSEYLDLSSGALCTTYPFSISAWMKVNDVDNDYGVVFIGDDGSINNILGFLFSDGSAASNFYSAQVRSPTANQFADAGMVTASAWVHIGGVFASTTSRSIYPNGATKEEDTNTVAPGTPDSTDIGRRGNTSNDAYMDGKIGEVAIWCGVALSDANMVSLAAGNNPMTIGSPTAYWPLLTDANDDSGNGHDLTANGAGITYDSGDHPPVGGVGGSSGGGYMIWRLLSR